MHFSQRHGHKPVRMEPQRESMDDDLRSGLWNVFSDVVLRHCQYNGEPYFGVPELIWTEYYKKSADEMPRRDDYFKRVFAQAPWFEVYDIVEIVSVGKRPSDSFNRILKRDNAAYRIIDGKVTPIVDETEVAEVNSVLEGDSAQFKLARDHIARAVELYSQRPVADYRNAIKESISAAESAACALTGERNFKDALRKLQSSGLHPALAGVFNQLYGYTSDESGIRHALVDGATAGPAEAHYLLVSCSAFISYLMQLE